MLLLVLSCGDGTVEPPPPPPAPVATTVTVNPASATLTALEETARFTAEVRDQNGQVMAGAAVAWVSSEASVAAVDASGLVMAAANGSATITAMAGSVSGTAAVTVAQVVSAVAVSPTVDTLVAFGDTVRLVAEATDANGHGVAGSEFSWSSSDTLVARVDDTGLVETIAEGGAVVTATSSGVTGQADLKVVPPLPTTITISPDTVGFTALGEKEQLTTEVRDQLGRVLEHERDAWDSGDTLVATVDSTGLVTAAANGTATITAMAGEASGTAFVTVMQSVASVEVSPSADTIAPGDTLRLVAKAGDANGHAVAGAEYGWASGNPAVAVVDTTGLVRGIGGGTATITATAGSAQGTARITVPITHNTPPYRGTVGLDPDIILPSDPTDFVGLERAGRGERFVADRRHGWITMLAYLFDATFANGLSVEFQVNPEFGTWAEAEAAARAYAPALGQIPVALRTGVGAVWIHRGDEAFGGSRRGLTVHTDRGDKYRKWGILPEVFVHEGVHASLDSAHENTPGWLAAQVADPTYISTYARDHPEREDVAESFSAWLAVRHRRDRITEGMADTITSAIPHRLAYFDSLDLNLCPVVTGAACEERALWSLSGTVSHGWANPESGPSVMTHRGRVVGAVVEVVDGPDAGRQTATDDHGRYLLESLEEAQFTVRATAEGFASVDRTLVLTSDTALPFATSRKLPPPGPPATFPDTDPEWLRMLSSDYAYAHQVANVRVFSDISPTFSEEHAEHLSRVWAFFDDLYAKNRGAYVDAYYTADSTVFQKVVPHCPTIFIPGARNLTACYLDYPRWFIFPFQTPDFGTQLHEIGHDFLFATWPGAWRTSNWFVEGTAMYYEGGVFTDEGSLRVPVPFSWCTDLFQRFDREGSLMPLEELFRLSRDAYLADNWRTYSQSCMLFDYLERHEPGVLYALIHRINAGQITSNDELIAALLELIGKSAADLEEAYEAYARITGGN
jgi:uncharacterized protein YjdB